MGHIDTKLVECINNKQQKWVIRWDMKPESDGVSYYEERINYKPTFEDIQNIVLNGMNKEIDRNILEGFVWKNMAIWLSTENQFNYKAAYDLAVQTNGMNLPITFKFGTTQEPIYYTFENVQDLSDFYISAMSYINTRLSEGWVKKDSVDWSIYNIQ